MNQLVFTGEELREMKSLLAEVAGRYSGAEDPALLKEACLYAHELPRRVRQFLNEFKSFEQPPGMCVLRGYPIDDAKIGRTPTHWQSKLDVSPSLEEELLLIMFGSLLGDLVGWATQQDGHIIHDVLPIQGHEHEQLGSSSEEPLWWHTEDAFHPYRCDYLGMLCLRNPDQVETTVAHLDCSNLDEKQIEVLFQPHFTIRPDESHLEKNKAQAHERPDGEQELLTAAYQKINRMQSSPDKLSVLFGDPRTPYVRIDPYFMDQPADEEAQRALDALVKQFDQRLTGVVLQPGDFIFIDNYRVVHGRKPFKARYDGFDRWIKRINVTRDLRKSRNMRRDSASQVIF